MSPKPVRTPRPTGRHRRRVVSALVAAAVAAVPLLVSPAAAVAQSAPSISVLSGRAETVMGGDAAVRVDVPEPTDPSDVTIRAGGEDVTPAFAASGRSLTGVIAGLPLGEVEITADVPGGVASSLTVTNHPQWGPVFSGPHEEPFICETADFEIPVIGGTLGDPVDEHCSIDDRVEYFYRTTGGEYAAWPEGAAAYPDDMAEATTVDGRRVPFIVRMEIGTVNRAVFEMAVLHDPLTEPDPSIAVRPSAWNGAAIFTLGGGCAGGWYRQGRDVSAITSDFMLGQGYAVMSSSLNVFRNNCNDVLAAESAMGVREEFVERYGEPDHVMAFGSSGGSYQALQISDNYPGIFNGIVIGSSFPDVGFATGNVTTDGRLLDAYFASAGEDWSEEQKQAVAGFRTNATMPTLAREALRFEPTTFCDDALPVGLRYDAADNPAGARCEVFSHAENVYGTDPLTGLVRNPHDNVGVQYGLAALREGVITVDQFLDLNARIGGFDDDLRPVDERTEGDREAIETAYRTGRVLNGGGGLADIPIIDHRAYLDEAASGDLHLRYHSLSLRQRLIDANGTDANLVSLLRESRHPDFSREAITGMNLWLRAIAADDAEAPPIDKVVSNRPEGLEEGCYLRDATRTFVADPLDRDPASTCEQLYPSASFPREVAGEGVAGDVIKCSLTDPDPAAYAVAFTEEQWQRLLSVFDAGVCDYSVPGVGQQDPSGTWLSF